MYSIDELRTIINECRTIKELIDSDNIIMQYEQYLDPSVLSGYMLLTRWRFELLKLIEL